MGALPSLDMEIVGLGGYIEMNVVRSGINGKREMSTYLPAGHSAPRALHVTVKLYARLGRGLVFDDEIAAQPTGCASDAISEVEKGSEAAGNFGEAKV